MAIPLDDPTIAARYIDENGRLTPDGMRLFIRLLTYVRDHEARLVAGGL